MKKSFYYLSYSVLYLQSIAFSSETPFPSDAHIFSPAQRQEAALASLINPNRDAVGVALPLDESHNSSIPTAIVKGNLKGTDIKKDIKITIQHDQKATQTVKIANINDAHIGGNVAIKASEAKIEADNVSLANMENTTIDGDLDMEL